MGEVGLVWFGGLFLFLFCIVLLFVVLRGIDKAEVQASMEMTVTPSSWPVPQWVLQSFPCVMTLVIAQAKHPLSKYLRPKVLNQPFFGFYVI